MRNVKHEASIHVLKGSEHEKINSFDILSKMSLYCVVELSTEVSRLTS